MRMETRVILKLLALILQDSLTKCKGQSLKHSKHCASKYKREDVYCDAKNNAVKKKVIGNSDNEWQFNLPLDRSKNGSGRAIKIVNFENAKVRKIVDGINDVVALAYDDDDKISILIE